MVRGGYCTYHEGRSLPIRQSYDLRVVGASGPVSLFRNGSLLANASGNEDHNFRGLERGIYTISTSGATQEALINGDLTLDLKRKASLQGNTKRMIGIVLIMTINLVGILLIYWIKRKG